MATLNNRDKVRLMVGDTDATDPLLSDTEVDTFLTQRTIVAQGRTTINLPAAAADCAGAIAAGYAREFDFQEDGQSFSRSQRVAHYHELEYTLRKRQGGYSQPVGGGTANTF